MAKKTIGKIAEKAKQVSETVVPDKEDLKNAGSKIKDKARDAKASVKGVASNIGDKTHRKKDEDDSYVKSKKDMIFQSGDALQQVVNVVNEAAMALNDSGRTIRESAIPETLLGALGAGIGGAGSFAALYGLGTVGLSAVGISTGLATAGAVVGGGMVAGIFVLAAPIAALSAGGVALASSAKRKQLRQEKERLYKEAIAKHEGIIKALKEENDADKERLDYLQSLNILLTKAIEDLQQDLGIS